MIKLLPNERETIIRFADDEDEAIVCTSMRTWMTKCEKAGCKCISDEGHTKTYVTDKKLVSLRSKKRKGRTLTDDQMKKMQEARQK